MAVLEVQPKPGNLWLADQNSNVATSEPDQAVRFVLRFIRALNLYCVADCRRQLFGFFVQVAPDQNLAVHVVCDLGSLGYTIIHAGFARLVSILQPLGRLNKQRILWRCLHHMRVVNDRRKLMARSIKAQVIRLADNHGPCRHPLEEFALAVALQPPL